MRGSISHPEQWFRRHDSLVNPTTATPTAGWLLNQNADLERNKPALSRTKKSVGPKVYNENHEKKNHRYFRRFLGYYGAPSSPKNNFQTKSDTPWCFYRSTRWYVEVLRYACFWRMCFLSDLDPYPKIAGSAILRFSTRTVFVCS